MKEWSPKETVVKCKMRSLMLKVCVLLDSGKEKERSRERYIAFYIARESHPGIMALFILIGRNIPLKLQRTNNSRTRQ